MSYGLGCLSVLNMEKVILKQKTVNKNSYTRHLKIKLLLLVGFHLFFIGFRGQCHCGKCGVHSVLQKKTSYQATLLIITSDLKDGFPRLALSMELIGVRYMFVCGKMKYS